MDLDEQELRATRKMHGLDYTNEEEDNQEKEKKEEKDGNQV